MWHIIDATPGCDLAVLGGAYLVFRAIDALARRAASRGLIGA